RHAAVRRRIAAAGEFDLDLLADPSLGAGRAENRGGSVGWQIADDAAPAVAGDFALHGERYDCDDIVAAAADAAGAEVADVIRQRLRLIERGKPELALEPARAEHIWHAARDLRLDHELDRSLLVGQ